MDPKTKNLLPNLLCLKTLVEREILFREMLAEFLCGLYIMETRLPGGNGSHGHSHSEEPDTPAEKNVSNPAETAANPVRSPSNVSNGLLEKLSSWKTIERASKMLGIKAFEEFLKKFKKPAVPKNPWKRKMYFGISYDKISPKILAAAENHLNEDYIPNRNQGVDATHPRNDCDIWVKKVLDEAGVMTPPEFHDPARTTCAQHIRNMASLLTSTPLTGWNIGLWEGKKPGTSHAVLVHVNSDGSVTVYSQGHYHYWSSKPPAFNSVSAMHSNPITADTFSNFHYYHIPGTN